MKKIILFYLFILIAFNYSSAQIGLGVSGGGQYPGFSESDNFKIHFDAGLGYGFFIRHDLYKFNDQLGLHARYTVKYFFNDIDLPNSGETHYKFTNFSIDLLAVYYKFNPYNLYGGICVNLLSAKAKNKYVRDYTDERIIPILISGLEYKLSQNYNLFSELFYQFGYTSAGEENLPINGMGILIGATMFISD